MALSLPFLAKFRTKRSKKNIPAEAHALFSALHERWLCALLIIAKLLLTVRRWNEMAGSDAGSHLEMVRLLSWTHPTVGVKDFFYAYHPPLGFLLAHSFYAIGFTDRVAVQLLNLAASLGAFLLMRGLLRRLDWLRKPAAVAFLYLAAAMPIQQYLQTSMNLDVLVLCGATSVLWCSVRLCWLSPSAKQKLWLHALLWSSIVLTVMTKYSGVLLVSIPLFAAAFSPRKIPRRLWFTLLLTLTLAGAATFPYYYLRYERPFHTFFPNNGDWLNGGAQQDARLKRDADLPAFFRNVLLSDPFRPERVAWRDDKELRLWNAWWDFWVGIFAAPGKEKSVGLAELYLATLGCLLGLVTFLRQRTVDVPWRRFGWVLGGIAAVFVLSFIAYLYQNPFTGWGPVKGVYVAPAVYVVAFLLSEILLLPPFAFFVRKAWGQRLLLAFLAMYILVNLTLPVYV